MKKTNWTIENIGSLAGKRVIVTGGGSGIGFQAAKVLASKGAEVILAVRTLEKGQKALDKIIALDPSAKVCVMHLDLGDLKSIKSFAEEFSDKYNTLDLLINNAGVMVPPYKHTVDGFELQFGTNHLGHFALTGRLLPTLLDTPGSKIVTVSSIANRGAKIYFDNLDGSKGYNRMNFYRQSKFANLLFAVELNNRLKKSGANTISVVCHPGISSTNLTSMGSGKESGKIIKFLFDLAAQPAENGALPTLFAATNTELKGGEYIGPDGSGNRKGNPVICSEVETLFKPDVAEKLWEVSEQLTGVNITEVFHM
jgi:NAD(P)-dependent dehydrogenase (short-subunit alcohol dehydrogenase family)